VSATPIVAALDAVRDALAAGGGEWRLRDEVESDREFVDELYTAIRWDELAAIPWPDAAKRAFLRDQSRLQADHYRRNYPGAALCVVECDGAAVGRFYLYASAGEYRLMDIALVPAWRGRGHGGRMLAALMAAARAERRQITLHVEPNNPAQRLYARLGFELIEDRGVYHFLGWTPVGASIPEVVRD
jgi:ribosomal protein S18 acetylase RimI-like enzyme